MSKKICLFLFTVFLSLMIRGRAYAATANDGFNPGADADVYSMAFQSNGKILAVGGFTNIGGQTRNRIAQLNPDGTQRIQHSIQMQTAQSIP